MGATDDWLAQRGKINGAKTAVTLTADDRTADEFAEHVNVGAALGVPPIVVGADPKAYKARLIQKGIADAVADAPKTAAWLKNREYGGLAKDDVENLSWFEKGLKDFGEMGDNPASRGVARGILQMGGNLKAIGAIQSGIVAADIGKSQQQLQQEAMDAVGPEADDYTIFAAQMAGQARYEAIQYMSEPDRVAMIKDAAERLTAGKALLNKASKIARSDAGQRFMDGPLAKSDGSFLGAISALADDPLGAIAFLGDTAAESLPALIPAGITTAVTRSPAAGAAMMGGTSAITTASSEAMSFLDQRGIKLETPADVAALLANPAVMKEAQQYGVTKGLIVGALDALSGGVAGKAMSASPVGNMVLQSVTQAALGSGGELAAQAAVDGKLNWNDIIIEGLAEFTTAPVEVVAMGRDWLKTTSAAKRSGEATELLKAIDKNAAASKVKVRSPDAFSNAMQAVMDGKAVFVPAEGVAEYFQSKNMTFNPADWGIDAGAYDAAVVSGGKVAVPAAAYASAITGTPEADWFHDNASVTLDDDMSVAEAKAFDEAKADWLGLAAIEQDRIFADEQEALPVETSIYETMVSRGLAAGESSEVATNNAQLFPALFSTLAQRSGVKIRELANRYALPLIQGSIPEGVKDRSGVRRALIGGALDNIRRNGPVRDADPKTQADEADRAMQKAYPETRQAKPFTNAIKGRGGIKPGSRAAAELAARGITPATAPGLFKADGMADVDNIVASEMFDGPSVIAEDGNGYLSRDAVIEAIEREARGEKVPRSVDAQRTMQEVAALRDAAGQWDGSEMPSRGYAGRYGAETVEGALAAKLDAAGIDLAAMSNDEVIAAIEAAEGRELFQGERGSIKFPADGLRNGESIISLFKSANLSTFLHETGHYFLEVFSDLASDVNAPSQLKDDLAAVHEWLGSTPGEKFTTAQHEQFAQGIEAYLMEGKSPSVALARAFSKFRAWMQSVYKKVGLNVQLTPEIRAVFDRMLATDQEIAEAKHSVGDAVLTSAADLGMSPLVYERFVQLAQDANAEATAKLSAETMAPIRRAREKEYREERAKVVAEVTPGLQSKPVYRATQEMRFGKGFDGEAVPVMKLDRAAIERDYGAAHIPLLPGATVKGQGHATAVFGPDGVHPDQAAGAYRFETGAELLTALENAPPIKEAIAAEADRIMFERHGDVLNDGSVEALALDAIHGDKRAQVLSMELSALDALAGNGGGKRAKIAQIKELARLTLAGSRVSDAISSHRYVVAAKRAGDASYRAVVKGDIATAAEQKRRQLMNHAFYVESRKVAATVDSIQGKVARLNGPDARLGKSRDIDHVKAARAIAAKFGLARGDSDFDFAAWVDQMKADDPDNADAMVAAIQTYTQDAKDFKKLTVDELGAVSDAIDNILAAGKRSKTLEIEGRKVDRDEAEAELVAVMDARGYQDNAADRGAMSAVQRLMKNATSLTGSARAMMRVVETWALTMDDGKAGGPFTKYLVRPVFDALGEYFTARKDRMDAILQIVKDADLTGKAIVAHELRAAGDQPFTFQNKAALIHAILHTGNASNKAKMLIGWRFSDGFVNPQQAVTAKGKPRAAKDGTPIMTKGELDTSRWDAFLDRQIAEGVITAKDIELVNAIWAQFEQTKRPAQATHKKLHGHYFREVENTPYDTPVGRLNGGYVPAIIDKEASPDAGRQSDLRALDQQSASMFPTTGSGFTKSRVENYREPLELNLMLIPAHMDNVLRFTYLEPAIKQTSGLVTRRSLRDKLQAFDPALVGDTLMPWLARTAKRSVASSDGTAGRRSWGRVFDRLRGRIGISIMFMNIVNTAQQVTGPIVALNEVRGKTMASSLMRFSSGGAFKMRDAITAASPYMKERLRLVQNDSAIAIEDLVRDKGMLTSVDMFTQKHGYILQSAFQNVLDIVVWTAAYDDAVAKGQAQSDAVFDADSVVRRTMADSAPENVTAFAMGSTTWRSITMFSSFFISQANLIGSSASIIRRQMGWKGAPKMFWAYLTLFAIPAILSQAISDAATGGGPDDEDRDGWGDDLAAWFGMGQAKYAAAMVPLAGKIGLGVINAFNDNPMDDRLSVSPVISAIETGTRATSTIYGAVADGKSARRATVDGLQVLSMLTGIPTGQLGKMVGYGIGVKEDRYDPKGPLDITQGLMSGRDGTE